jgi:uncharacterized protein YkwD
MKKTTIYIGLLIIFANGIGGFSIEEKQIPIEQVSASELVLEKTPEPNHQMVQPSPEVVIEKPVVASKSVPSPTPKKVITTPKVAEPTPKPASQTETDNCDSGSFNVQFLCLLNNYRRSKGLNSLTYDTSLNDVAQTHSSWMNTNGAMSHIGLNGSTFDQRCREGGTSCDAENVAWNYTTAQKLFDAWKASPSHNKNMLGAHTKTGLSLVGAYATSLFR